VLYFLLKLNLKLHYYHLLLLHMATPNKTQVTRHWRQCRPEDYYQDESDYNHFEVNKGNTKGKDQRQGSKGKNDNSNGNDRQYGKGARARRSERRLETRGEASTEELSPYLRAAASDTGKGAPAIARQNMIKLRQQQQGKEIHTPTSDLQDGKGKGKGK
jgi:hypothetical protein